MFHVAHRVGVGRWAWLLGHWWGGRVIDVDVMADPEKGRVRYMLKEEGRNAKWYMTPAEARAMAFSISEGTLYSSMPPRDRRKIVSALRACAAALDPPPV